MTESEQIAAWTVAAQNGEPSAFESLYAAYGSRIYYFCLGLMGEAQAAVEVTRDVFLYAWRNMRSMPSGKSFFRWLCGNAFYFSKIAVAGLRGSGWTVTEPDDDGEAALCFGRLPNEGTASGTPPQLRREDLEALTRLLNGLQENERICVLLYAYAGFSVSDIAGIVSATENAVKGNVYNGLQALCRGLNEREYGSGDALLPLMGRALRVCGKHCTLPQAVTQGIREGLAANRDVFQVPPKPVQQRSGVQLGKRQTIAIGTVLAVLLLGAVLYVVYWFASAGGQEAASSENSSVAAGTVSTSSVEHTASDITLSTDESEESSVGDETSDTSSEPTVSDPSGESSSVPPVAEYPRTSVNLRMRSEPKIEENNIVTLIPGGSHVDILETVTAEDGTRWHRVQFVNSAGTRFEGYCAAEYIETGE